MLRLLGIAREFASYTYTYANMYVVFEIIIIHHHHTALLNEYTRKSVARKHTRTACWNNFVVIVCGVVVLYLCISICFRYRCRSAVVRWSIDIRQKRHALLPQRSPYEQQVFIPAVAPTSNK